METVDLTDAEQHLLVWGLQVWQGACRPSSAMSRALGFTDDAEVFPWTSDKVKAIGSSTELSRADWTKLMLLVEIGFASNTMGAGLRWTAITGIPGDRTLQLLHSVQGKVRAVILQYHGRTREAILGSE